MNLRNLPLLTAVLLLPLGACGDPKTDDAKGPDAESLPKALAVHSTWAITHYDKTLAGIDAMDKCIQALVADPTEENLAAVKTAWIDARRAYSPTEVLRFSDGPIEEVEGLINAWPLDETYLDKILESPDKFPKLDAKTLRELNEKDGEKNIATGWHAIEYLLWGPDTSKTGPGNRPASYFKDGPFASRRRDALVTLTAALREDIAGVAKAWKDGWFTNQKSETALHGLLRGAVYLSGDELAGERIAVALEARDQEEEHSCFSDTTHIDHLQAARGVQAAYRHVHSLVETVDADRAKKTQSAVDAAVAACEAIPAPFDNAIIEEPGRVKVGAAMEALETAAAELVLAAKALGVTVDYDPGE